MKRIETISLPALFLRDLVLLPSTYSPIFIGREKSIAAVNAAKANEKRVFLPLQRRASADDPKASDIYKIGTIASILQILELPDGTMRLTLEYSNQGEMLNCKIDGDYWRAEVRSRPYKKSRKGWKTETSRLLGLRHEQRKLFQAMCIERLSQLAQLNAHDALKEINNLFKEKNRPSDVGSGSRNDLSLIYPLGNFSVINRYRGTLKLLSNITSIESEATKTPLKAPARQLLSEIKSMKLNFRQPLTEAVTKKETSVAQLPLLISRTIAQGPLSNRTKQTLVEIGRLQDIASHLSNLISTDIKKLKLATSEQRKLPLVFISHANADKSRIKPILLGLLGAGFRLFIDKPDQIGLSDHPRVFGVGSRPFRSEISNALKQSSCVLALWSNKSTEDHRTELHEEASFGKDHGILVQVSIDNFKLVHDSLPLGFREWQMFDISKNLEGYEGDNPIDVTFLIREINDTIRRNPNTNAPLAPWRQASAAVGMAIIDQQLRTLPKPPPPAPPTTQTVLNQLRNAFLKRAQVLAERLVKSNHYMEQDIASVLRDVIFAFDRPLDSIDLAIAPSLGELLVVMRDSYKDLETRKEIAPHILPALQVIASSYETFIARWGAWADQQRDPARELVTPENADRTREAADIVIEFATNANVVHHSVPDVLLAIRQLIKPALSFSRFNEYRYLNAIGEGLRACWNEGERYINDNWPNLQRALVTHATPDIGPFNDFFLEMADALIQLSEANPELFGWLFMRVGYLRRLKSGDLLKPQKKP